MNKESITVSIPAFNEEQTVETVVEEALMELKRLTSDYELLLINDGSTDQTGNIMHRLAKKDKRIRIIEHKVNKGFSAVITAGLFNASKNLVLLAPADGQFNFKDLHKFVKAIKGKDGVVAYRIFNAEPLHRKIQSATYHTISKVLFGINLREFSSIYMWRTAFLKGIKVNSSPDGNAAQIEIVYKVQKSGGLVAQVPIYWKMRQGGKPKGEINLRLIVLTLKDIWILFFFDRVQAISNYFSYYFTEFAVKILTLNLLLVKKLIVPFVDKQKNVLDLGCGIGTMSSMFPKNNYLGIDIDGEAIKLAKKDYPGYKFEVVDVTNFRIKKQYDLFLIVGVLHHLSNKEVAKTLNNISHCLKRDSKIIIIEAIPPIFKWNLIGSFLRAHDKGRFIRPIEKYKNLIGKKFKIDRCEAKLGGFFDYAFLVATN